MPPGNTAKFQSTKVLVVQHFVRHHHMMHLHPTILPSQPTFTDVIHEMLKDGQNNVTEKAEPAAQKRLHVNIVTHNLIIIFSLPLEYSRSGRSS